MTVVTFAAEGNALTWTGDGEYLRIEPWGADSVRVRSARMHEVANPDWALLPEPAAPSPDARVDIDEQSNTAQLRNGNIVVKAVATDGVYSGSGYEEPRCALTFLTADGKVLLRESPRGGSLNLHARRFQPITGGECKVTVSFEAPADERLYGMGEYQQNVMDLKGCTLELAHRNSQASVPFVVSSAGYGFLWNNPAIGSVTFGKNRTEWKADATSQIDYWICAGGTPAAIMEHYADATGHAPVMPEWGLGFWQCKLRYWNQEQLLEVAREFKRRQIPIDLIVIDFFHWPHMGDFRFEEEFWPDPKAMADELHEMGIKLMVSVWPQVAVASENYAEMKSRNLLVKADAGEDIGMMFEGPSQFFDATNPKARAYVWGKCRANYADLGADAFWLDEAEPEYGTYDFENYRYFAGPNQQIANLYPREYNRGFYEGQLAMGRENEIVNLTRCAWAGSQRYGALVWSGDVGSTFDDLKAQVTCAIHMGMAGIPWFTTDMGGFHDGDINSEYFREVLARWCQFSCFSPVMRNHGDRSALQPDGTMKQTITNAAGEHRSPSGADNEPWSYGETIEAVFTKYIGIRERMREYMRELFDEAHRTGHPLMRGLFFEFPDDATAADIADEYMLGADLLVAPVMEEGARSREVYLPGDAGVSWTCLHDGSVHQGGTTIQTDAPLDVIPVFARDGRDHGLAGAL
ncbi:glycoside hydrolase family 31 protein [Bifidobacterium eulemuris]|uniref:Family 31 glucosidase n=1 Tax=Bifidobacterium eulemuris TaxID=1765219 RepID=A0A261GDQ8_9BIFI|nr:TIM-barrel domain-containing protein [Bifidobacterium eulemuris]OZG69571.1 family 31 glucosidase [Bifidobacterium eulemuris]QOL32114.1 glycoside hydrolase family 31 protein [Bifidobacterium eulemuris]